MVVAAIEGYAIGGGMALALAADWRVIGRSAYLCVPEVRLGMPLSWGTIPRIASLVGPARAKRVVTLCERFVGQQALDIGLADRVAGRPCPSSQPPADSRRGRGSCRPERR
jgi:enoyl-CoA hydratase/carnithine racemase